VNTNPINQAIIEINPGTSDYMRQYKAIILIGPTGSGKTPLGELIERQGL